MRARIYFNLHNHKWSVQTKQPKGWRLYGHFETILATPIKWTVMESGRQRVIKTKQKNVHAWLDCIIDQLNPDSRPGHLGREITYNPYDKGFFFYRKTGKKVPNEGNQIFFDSFTKSVSEVLN